MAGTGTFVHKTFQRGGVSGDGQKDVVGPRSAALAKQKRRMTWKQNEMTWGGGGGRSCGRGMKVALSDPRVGTDILYLRLSQDDAKDAFR